MRWLPLAVDVAGRPALVVGAGELVLAKVERLLAAGALVTVCAPGEVAPGVAELAVSRRITLVHRAPAEPEVAAAVVIFVAPEEEAIADALAARARREGRLVSTIDRPERSTFVSPAVTEASGVIVTVATDGVSPGLAKRLREDLAAAGR